MSARELVVLGSASQVPTRTRNHNGYFLRWDGEGILFDPGEGTQRQMTFAGVPASAVTRICVTHFHGDHSLGLPGILQRLSLDGVTRVVPLAYPSSGEVFVERLRGASAFDDHLDLLRQPVDVGPPAPGAPALRVVDETPTWRLLAAPLQHRVDTVGWRVEERPGRTMLPDRLAAARVAGPEVGRLQREGAIDVGGRTVTLGETSVERPGQAVAFVMDTAWCAGALALAEGADLLVCEATFASSEAHLAADYGHLTATEAGRLAAEAGVRRLVITHFSQRYPDVGPLLDEAASAFSGEVVAAEDLLTVVLPARRGR